MYDFNEQYMCEPKPVPMRTVAEILALAERTYYSGPISGMCAALKRMGVRGRCITREEEEAALRAIDDYLHIELDSCQSYLDYALREAVLPHDEAACRAIYKDWDNRPRPRK